MDIEITPSLLSDMEAILYQTPDNDGYRTLPDGIRMSDISVTILKEIGCIGQRGGDYVLLPDALEKFRKSGLRDQSRDYAQAHQLEAKQLQHLDILIKRRNLPLWSIVIALLSLLLSALSLYLQAHG